MFRYLICYVTVPRNQNCLYRIRLPNRLQSDRFPSATFIENKKKTLRRFLGSYKNTSDNILFQRHDVRKIPFLTLKSTRFSIVSSIPLL